MKKFRIILISLFFIFYAYAQFELSPEGGIDLPDVKYNVQDFYCLNEAPEVGKPFDLLVKVELFDKYQIYKKDLKFELKPNDKVEFSGKYELPEGYTKTDEVSNVEHVILKDVFYIKANIKLLEGFNIEEDTISGTLTIFGCNYETGICDVQPTDIPLNIVVKDIQKASREIVEIVNKYPQEQSNKSLSKGISNTDIKTKSEGESIFDLINNKDTSFILVVFFAFIGGLLTAFTPCVFPLIPITVSVISGKNRKTKIEKTIATVFYVSGMVFLYALIGAVAGIGRNAFDSFGSFQNNPWVYFGAGCIFILLSLSMFGLYDIKLPNFGFKTTNGNKSYIEVFLMGMLAGLVATPCLAPPLFALLTYILTKGDTFTGAILMSSFAMGMGVILALFGNFFNLVPGEWMESVKRSLGFVLLAVAAWFMRAIIGFEWYQLLLAMVMIVYASVLGAFDNITKESKWTDRLKKGIAFIILILGIVLLIGNAHHVFGTKPLFSGGNESVADKKYEWPHDYTVAFEKHVKEKMPLIVYFHSDTCVYCPIVEKEIFTKSEFKEEMKRFSTVEVNMSKPDAAGKAAYKEYEVIGFPTVVLVNTDGKVESYAGKDPVIKNIMNAIKNTK